LFTKHYSGDQNEEDEMGGACSGVEERRGACRLLVGKPEGNRPFERPRRRFENNIKVVFKKFN
jgi:hypothetical protein